MSFLVEIFNQLAEFVIFLLPFILPILWLIAIIVYSLKFFSPQWDEFTRFGKLENVKSWPRIPTLSNKLGWIIFYLFSCFMFFISFFVKYPPLLPNYLLFIHSFRRLVESILITKFSNRKMHFINFLAGLCFYFMTPLTLSFCSKPLGNGLKTIYFIFALILNIFQFIVHKELSGLKKYSIPHGKLFKKLTSPHYTLEIALYFIYFISAPHYLTFMMLIFVIENLSHQANLTYQWYIAKFGLEFTSLHRYIVFPHIY